MVNKITTPPTQNEVINKVNELVEGKQDTLVSGTNIKTVNNTSILGSGNISIPVITVDSALSTSSTNPVRNSVVTTAISGKIDTSAIQSYVSSSSTNSQVVGAKLFYDTVGDIETVINTIRGV